MKKIIVKENEERTLPILWTGEETDISYEIRLAAPGASIKLRGLLLGGEEHNLKLALHVIHEAPQTTSNVIIKSALSDNAQVSIDGLVTIASGAKKSKAWLAAHLLLLSNKAKGRAVPSLEILENDIKAGHATTVGKIDEEALFYLMSRGLPRKRAKQLIVEGFLQDMINEMPPALAKRAKKNLPYHNILI